MALIRWWGDEDPRAEFGRLSRDLNRLMSAFDPWFGGSAALQSSGVYPSINLYDDGEMLHRTTAGELAERLGLTASGAQPLSGWSVPSFDSDGSTAVHEATWFVGHPTEQQCFEVRTRYGRRLRVTGDHPLIEFAFEPGCDGKTDAVEEVQSGLIGKLVAARGHVGDALLLFANKLRRSNSTQRNLAREVAHWKHR